MEKNGIRVEGYGITLSLLWEGKGLQLKVDISEARRRVHECISECSGEGESWWQVMNLLKVAQEHSAELNELHTHNDRIHIALNFRSSTQLDEFCEAIGQL